MKKLSIIAVSLVAFALFATASVSTLVAVEEPVSVQMFELAGNNDKPGGG